MFIFLLNPQTIFKSVINLYKTKQHKAQFKEFFSEIFFLLAKIWISSQFGQHWEECSEISLSGWIWGRQDYFWEVFLSWLKILLGTRKKLRLFHVEKSPFSPLYNYLCHCHQLFCPCHRHRQELFWPRDLNCNHPLCPQSLGFWLKCSGRGQ